MQKIITGILSYGMSGRVFHAPFVEAHSGFELYAVTERSKKQAAGRYPRIKSFDTVDDLIADDRIELVIVNTPNNTHYEYSKLALLAGKHVLVEKPFATSSEEAKELFEISRRVDKKILAYHNRRWDSDFLSVKRVIESGVLGKLMEVHFRFDRYKNAISPKVFKEIDIPGSGVTYDLGPHLLDQVISLFGKPVKSTKALGINREKSIVDDYSTFHLIYPNNLNVFVTANLLVANPLPSFVVHGTKGSYIKERTDVQEEQLLKEITPSDDLYGIEHPGKEGNLVYMNENGETIETAEKSERGNYIGLFDAVYRQIRLNEEYPIKEEELVCQMEILEQRSL